MEFSDFNELEKIVLSGDEISIKFNSMDKIELIKTKTNSGYRIELIMPWGNIYAVGNYKSKLSLNWNFNRYHKFLKKGGYITITSMKTARILKS